MVFCNAFLLCRYVCWFLTCFPINNRNGFNFPVTNLCRTWRFPYIKSNSPMGRTLIMEPFLSESQPWKCHV